MKIYNNYKNKGFSLVELIIVIAIMAVLAAAIAPALIRYINKSRKADDIAAADAIGATFQSAMTEDEDMYDWLNACCNKENLGKLANDRPYRVVAYCSIDDGYAPSDFKLVTTYLGGVDGLDKQLMHDKMAEYFGASSAPLKFKRPIYLDQWIICIDPQGKLSVWVGGGFGSASCWLGKENCVYGKENSSYAFKLWPGGVDSDYNKMTVPPRKWGE